MKKVGIIGSGAVAKALAKGFVAIGYEVKMGTCDKNKLADIQNVIVGSIAEAADFADIIVLAVKGTVASEVLKQIHTENKIVIDTTNPIDDKPPINGVLQYFTDKNSSLGEIFQKENPNTHIVKAFNSVGSAFMVNPDFEGIKPTMFICGNSEGAKAKVTEILTAFNWETEDVGKIESAGPIEALCQLWCLPGFLNNQWSQAFKFLKK